MRIRPLVHRKLEKIKNICEEYEEFFDCVVKKKIEETEIIEEIDEEKDVEAEEFGKIIIDDDDDDEINTELEETRPTKRMRKVRAKKKKQLKKRKGPLQVCLMYLFFNTICVCNSI